VSGQRIRVDSLAAAQDFVEGPARVSFGLGAQTEVYGFYPGLGNFDAIRHKITPSVSYSYAPAVTPTALQEQVFGSRALGVQSALTLTFNQTFEARVSEREGGPRTGAPGTAAPGAGVDPLTGEPDPEAIDPDEEDPELAPLGGEGIPAGGEGSLDSLPGASDSALDDEGLRRPPPTRVVTLLALSTQAVSYDLVRADSAGRFIDGFTTQQIRNSVRSDFLRGLDFSFTHDLWEEPAFAGGSGGNGENGLQQRRFAPHLSQLALGFSLDDQSAPVRLLGRVMGIGNGDPDRPTTGTAPGQADDELELDAPSDGFNDDRIIPGMAGGRGRAPSPGIRRDGWNARVNYSLRRPRSGEGVAQMINGSMSFAPTELLGVSWTTGYDVEARAFTDHMISVQRDMYDWEASFGFRQSVNGNWLFRFEVSLKANRDLRFDHETRNLEGGLSGQPGGLAPGF
jgi:hypothetical protein